MQKDEAEIDSSVIGILNDLFQGEKKENKFEDVINSKPLKVSQGQYQRGSIARSLANSPPILLADEPTGNLDQLTGELAMQIFRKIVDLTQMTKSPKTVIVVTHDLLLALKFADEIIILTNGKKRSHYIFKREGRKKFWINQGNPRDKQFRGAELRKRLLSDLQH